MVDFDRPLKHPFGISIKAANTTGDGHDLCKIDGGISKGSVSPFTWSPPHQVYVYRFCASDLWLILSRFFNPAQDYEVHIKSYRSGSRLAHVVKERVIMKIGTSTLQEMNEG